MPELPEVETITNRLRVMIVNAAIIKCEVRWRKSIFSPSVEQFTDQIKNQKILSLSRRGKYILFHLTHDVMLIHLRMSGDVLVESSSSEITKHDHVIFFLDNDMVVKFNDTRKFGRVWLTDNPENILGKLGPEPLSEEFTAQSLFASLNSKHRQLKPLLLDQTFLAGMGNIYTDEALFDAGLSPFANSAGISEEESRRLHSSIQKTLSTGIQNNGASIDWVYKGGGFQNHFLVYQRTGQPCHKCGTAIQKIVLGQRGTHFCPRCQPYLGG